MDTKVTKTQATKQVWHLKINIQATINATSQAARKLEVNKSIPKTRQTLIRVQPLKTSTIEDLLQITSKGPNILCFQDLDL